jgi:hypothetical protein
MTQMFRIATEWESLTEESRGPLRRLVTELVGYPCKLACQTNNGSVDIYVLNLRRKKVTDWMEIQETGAIGVVFDQYSDPEGRAVGRLSDACDHYNETICVEFASDSEEGEDDSSETSEEEEENEKEKEKENEKENEKED